MPIFCSRKNQMDKVPSGQKPKEHNSNDQRPDWLSFANEEAADDDFLVNREDVITDEERIESDCPVLNIPK